MKPTKQVYYISRNNNYYFIQKNQHLPALADGTLFYQMVVGPGQRLDDYAELVWKLITDFKEVRPLAVESRTVNATGQLVAADQPWTDRTLREAAAKQPRRAYDFLWYGLFRLGDDGLVGPATAQFWTAIEALRQTDRADVQLRLSGQRVLLHDRPGVGRWELLLVCTAVRRPEAAAAEVAAAAESAAGNLKDRLKSFLG